jgi:hypothetical protein
MRASGGCSRRSARTEVRSGKPRERDRARQRAVVGIVLPTFWLTNLLLGLQAHPPGWFIVLGLTYGIASLVYLRVLDGLEQALPVSSMLFLLLDPIFLVGVLSSIRRTSPS